MAISDCRKIYNVYTASGCESTDDLATLSNKIRLWLEEEFSDLITVEIVENSETLHYINCYFKGTNAGQRFICSTATNTSRAIHYLYNSTYGVKSQANYNNSATVNLLVIRSEYGFVFDFFVDGGLMASNVLIYDQNGNIAIYLNESKLYLTCATTYNNYTALSLKSAYRQKVLSRLLYPKKDYIFEHLYRSDGIIVDNGAIYCIDGRYFVDIQDEDDYLALALEIK